MAIFQPKCLAPGFEIKDAKSDHRNAKSVGQYKVSDQAIYFPAMPGTEYIPFAAIEDIFDRMTDMPVTGCCGKCLPVKKIFVTVNGVRHEMVMDPPKYADIIMEKYENWKSTKE